MQEIINNQKGSNNTQIGEQNNHTENKNMVVHVETHSNTYMGASLEEVTKLVTNLFLDNFPRMQQIAKDTVEARINELWENIVEKLSKEGITNFSPFMEPDVQYVLYEAQKGYARFATNDMLANLSSLIAERIKNDDGDMCLKVTIDQAISIIPMLSSAQLDYLALQFLTTKVKFNNIHNLDDLKRHFEYLDATFSTAHISNWQHLNMLGCLQLELPDICKSNAINYKLNIEDIEKICPKNFRILNGDYSTSPIGTIIAIIYAEQKTNYHFDPTIWIHN